MTTSANTGEAAEASQHHDTGSMAGKAAAAAPSKMPAGCCPHPSHLQEYTAAPSLPAAAPGSHTRAGLLLAAL